jgi:hypothetical protein
VLTPLLGSFRGERVSSVALSESRSVGFAGEGRGEGRREAAMLIAVIDLRTYGGLDRGILKCAPWASACGWTPCPYRVTTKDGKEESNLSSKVVETPRVLKTGMEDLFLPLFRGSASTQPFVMELSAGALFCLAGQHQFSGVV